MKANLDYQPDYILLWRVLGRVSRLMPLMLCALLLPACSVVRGVPAVVSETSIPITLHAENLIETPTPQLSLSTSSLPTIVHHTRTVTATQQASRTPEATATPISLPCLSQGGDFIVDELESQLLADPLSYRVYLPPCYDELFERSYPVLYLIHGQSSNDDQWERLGAGSVVDELVAKGKLPPMLIVMPRDRLWKEPTEDKFGIAVAEELVPRIDKDYRTQPDRAYRAVGGLSRGGAWALHLGLEYWELFGSIGAHSGFIFHTDTYLVNGWLDEIPPGEIPRIFMDLADLDRPTIAQSARWFEDLLTRRGIAHEWRVYPGYHEEAYWQAHVEEYLHWYAQEWEIIQP